MKAALIGAARALTVTDIDRPVPAVGEVLIDVRYCGICGSDLHMLGLPADLVPAGHVLGHELTGVVSGLGPGVTGWSAGERVVVLPMVACGRCYACRAGHSNLCEQGGIDDGPGIGRPGGYAESVAVPAGMLRRLPSTVSDRDGALAEPLAVALRAIRLSGAAPDEPVCVLGAGPIGVLVMAGLLAAGFERVAVVEPGPGRRAAAERLGVRTAEPDEAVDEIPGLLGGQRPTVVDRHDRAPERRTARAATASRGRAAHGRGPPRRPGPAGPGPARLQGNHRSRVARLRRARLRRGGRPHRGRAHPLRPHHHQGRPA